MECIFVHDALMLTISDPIGPNKYSVLFILRSKRLSNNYRLYVPTSSSNKPPLNRKYKTDRMYIVTTKRQREDRKKQNVRSGPRFCPSETLRSHSLGHTPLPSHLHIGNSTLQRARQIDVEKRSVQAMHERHLRTGTFAVRLGVRPRGTQLLAEIATAAGADGVVVLCDSIFAHPCSRFLCIPRALSSQCSLVFTVLGCLSCAVDAADLSDGEDGLPALEDGGVVAVGRGVAEAGGGEGTFRPAVVDAGEVPVHFLGRGVAVQLVADVDEVLDACNVDVVDAAEIEDDRFQSGLVGFVGGGLATAGSGVVPGTVL